MTRYSTALVRALRQRADINVLELGGGPLVSRRDWRKKLVTARQELIWYPLLGRRSAAREGAQVYHCPTLRAPLTRGKPPLVLTVHDLVPLRFPETMSAWSRVYTRATLRRVIDAADTIVAVSQTTANDLNSLLRVQADRIRVVWSGVDSTFESVASIARPRAIDEEYVLFVGTPEPRKNLPRLIDAMTTLRARGRRLILVIAGGGGWGGVDVSAKIVRSVGVVSDPELAALYADASCVVLPSLYEGFGLPVIEAMAVGTPVVASRAGALPEIAGQAAVLVDPYDAGAIADGIEQAIRDRGRLVELGRERAKLFRWDTAASKMTEIYRELA